MAIKKQRKPWGVYLTCKPFSQPNKAHIQIVAEVAKQAGTGDVAIYFNQSLVSPFKISDARVFAESLKAVAAEARKQVELFRKAMQKPVKKPAKKKAKR